MLFRHLLLVATLFIATNAHALSADEVKGIIFGDTDARVDALSKAAANADDATGAFIQALADDAVKTSGDQVFVVRDDKAFDPLTGAEKTLPADAEDVINPNVMRGEIDNALAALKLFSKDEALRRDAIKTLRGDSDEARLPLIEKALALEKVPELKNQLAVLRAAILLGSSDRAKRLDAAAQLSASNNPATKTVLIERLGIEEDADVKVALRAALAKVEASLA